MSAKTTSKNLLAVGGKGSSRLPALPVTRDLTLAYVLSLLVALLIATAAVGGLLWEEAIYTTEDVLLSFYPVDLFHLVVGLPVLLSSMWLARHGRLAGLLLWPGVLLYVLYSYITNLLGVPFGPLFLPYVLLVTLSACTIIALVASIDGRAVRRKLDGIVPARAAGGLLVGLGALFLITNVNAILTALASRPPYLPEHPTFVLIADFTTAIPLCLAGGFLLWQRQALGYVAGAGLLLLYTLLFLGLVPVLLFPAVYDGSPVAVADVSLMLGFGLLCLWLLARWVRAAPSQKIETISPA